MAGNSITIRIDITSGTVVLILISNSIRQLGLNIPLDSPIRFTAECCRVLSMYYIDSI